MANDSVAFLSVDETIAIHDRLTARFGGQAALRDAGLLESSLYRPQTGNYEGMVAMAAALFESLLFNPAFVDGNRRLAFFATDVFLRLNGYRFRVDADEARRFIADLIEKGQQQRSAIQPLIRRSVIKSRAEARET